MGENILVNEEGVLLVTGQNVSSRLINMAQTVISVYTGIVDYLTLSEKDFYFYNLAVAYQAGYMNNNEDLIFQQIAASTISQNDSATTFKPGDDDSPWIAPLAKKSCQKMSIMSNRSIKTGRSMKLPTGFFDYLFTWERSN